MAGDEAGVLGDEVAGFAGGQTFGTEFRFSAYLGMSEYRNPACSFSVY
jgi:hypothetical protein